jgi:hypothetical protein
LGREGREAQRTGGGSKAGQEVVGERMWSWRLLTCSSLATEYLRVPWHFISGKLRMLKAYCTEIQSVLQREVCRLFPPNRRQILLGLESIALYLPTSAANFTLHFKMENLKIYP